MSEPVRCRECGKPVPGVRWCYAIPTCFGCLPPPEPLRTVRPSTRAWVWPLRATPLLPDACGRFGAVRTHDVHTGVDLYCERGTSVVAVEDGVVASVEWFTGKYAEGPDGGDTSWWNDTVAVLVAGKSGTVVYGEMTDAYVRNGDAVLAGTELGVVSTPVLKRDKGRPRVMLHVEWLAPGASPAWWPLRDKADAPPGYRDPLPMLVGAAVRSTGKGAPVYDPATDDGTLAR